MKASGRAAGAFLFAIRLCCRLIFVGLRYKIFGIERWIEKRTVRRKRIIVGIEPGALPRLQTQRLKHGRAFAFSADGRKIEPPALRAVVDSV